MSGSYDEASLAPEETTDSFWEVGNYKRTVKRIDDGHRLCNDLMNCVQERAKIEKAYAQQLTDWAKRWRQLIEKDARPARAGLGPAQSRTGTPTSDLEKVKNWQKDAYHKQIMGGFKETKEAEDGFRKAQKPWAKKMKELEAAKKAYHLACKEEKLAMTREMNSKTEQSVTPEQQKKLQDKVDKCKQDVQKTQEKYEKVLEDVGKTTPQYMESMEQVFEQCQQFEEKRLVFLKEVLLDIKRHLNLAENSSYMHVYRELEQAIRGADAQDDLRWFRSTSGPGMPMNWPQFEEWNPDLPHTTAKKEKQPKKAEGGTLPNATGAMESTSQAGDRGSVSSYDRGQPYATEWSDDESGNPFGGNEANGGANPFEDDAKGVRVRALYDYDGQEQDELSFKAGDELTKLGEEDEQGWCRGRCRGRLASGQLGLYPANYVEAI
ncbi:Protein kinase C and casein kinase substrate in neurons protein 1 [Tupaia chinensis]|uniref:Protein kinase C and casein kinase substrate in neurons protein 1 n=1 Tax=Tupaia chinensis TaxID=246437 RepID=L9L461_TUPCH|nr:Protein kinase C and casein kinase substrate in neurons protein 1 [Tupaia chinensis]